MVDTKPLIEYVSPKVWKILLALLIISVIVGTIVGAVNDHNAYIEREYEPWEYPPEARYPDG